VRETRAAAGQAGRGVQRSCKPQAEDVGNVRVNFGAAESPANAGPSARAAHESLGANQFFPFLCSCELNGMDVKA
jgi:hypothetical protein